MTERENANMSNVPTALIMQITNLREEIGKKTELLAQLEGAKSRYMDIRRSYDYGDYDYSYWADDDHDNDPYHYDYDRCDYIREKLPPIRNTPDPYESDDDWRCPTCLTYFRANCNCDEELFFFWVNDCSNLKDSEDPEDPTLRKSDREAQVDRSRRVCKRKREQAPQSARRGLRRAVKRVKKYTRRLRRRQTKDEVAAK